MTREFAERYTKAWCSQRPERVTEFFSADGWLKINDGDPAVGRVAMSGYEEWTMGPDVLIAQSLGHFDAAEYERQIGLR